MNTRKEAVAIDRCTPGEPVAATAGTVEPVDATSLADPGFYLAEGAPDRIIGGAETEKLMDQLLDSLAAEHGPLERVLLVPPDITRKQSGAGELTVLLWQRLSQYATVEVMPAVGTHFAMTTAEIAEMYPGIPADRFRAHRYRDDTVTLGTVPEEYVAELTDGRVSVPIDCAVNRLLVEGRWIRIISVGQLVPHELAGIANFSKNICIGVGGADCISKSHYVAAVYGLERLMGQIDSPMRRILSYMEQRFLTRLPITYLMTVRGVEEGQVITRGIFAGDDERAYRAGAALCRDVSITTVERPVQTVVAYMDPSEYHTTWVGNKAIYRTRMAVADGGRLIVLAPGVRQFGEDGEIDAFIRKTGYRTTAEMIALVESDPDVAANLTAVSHIIVSSPEGRFSVVYGAGGLTREEVEAAGFAYGDSGELLERYNPDALADGWNTLPDGEEIYFVRRPAAGLWMANRR